MARIPAGQVFESAPMDLFIPANAPDTITVRLEINHIYYHMGQTDEIKLHGSATRRDVSLKDTAYTGDILTALPGVSKGDQDMQPETGVHRNQLIFKQI